MWEMMQYPRFHGERTEERLDWTELKPGDTASGWLYYEILNAAKPAGLLYLGYKADPFATLLARFEAGRSVKLKRS